MIQSALSKAGRAIHAVLPRHRQGGPGPRRRRQWPLLAVSVIAFLGAARNTSSAREPEPALRPTAISPFQSRSGRLRPLIAVVGENSGTELTDFVIPYAILKMSGAADVLAVATQPGPLQMQPALRIQPEATIDGFDARYPDGADYIIVPAVRKKTNGRSPLTAWIKAQAGKGATIVSICDGALVVARAGLLRGHQATGHWATQGMREHQFPDTQWLTNVRYVADGKVISSAGVTAAIPLALALVEAIAGPERAAMVATGLGVSDWSPLHDSGKFHYSVRIVSTAIGNSWFSWHDDVVLPVATGVDDIALALTADAYGRTFRSRVLVVAEGVQGIETRNGLTLLPDHMLGRTRSAGLRVRAIDARFPAQALDTALAGIADAYGRRTASLVATQLEYAHYSMQR